MAVQPHRLLVSYLKPFSILFAEEVMWNKPQNLFLLLFISILFSFNTASAYFIDISPDWHCWNAHQHSTLYKYSPDDPLWFSQGGQSYDVGNRIDFSISPEIGDKSTGIVDVLFTFDVGFNIYTFSTYNVSYPEYELLLYFDYSVNHVLEGSYAFSRNDIGLHSLIISMEIGIPSSFKIDAGANYPFNLSNLSPIDPNEDALLWAEWRGFTNLESIEVVPEPATIFLLGTGLVGLAGLRKRKYLKK
jgi:hypothetical protein